MYGKWVFYGGSFSGRTTDSDSVNPGSNPGPPATDRQRLAFFSWPFFENHELCPSTASHSTRCPNDGGVSTILPGGNVSITCRIASP